MANPIVPAIIANPPGNGEEQPQRAALRARMASEYRKEYFEQLSSIVDSGMRNGVYAWILAIGGLSLTGVAVALLSISDVSHTIKIMGGLGIALTGTTASIALAVYVGQRSSHIQLQQNALNDTLGAEYQSRFHHEATKLEKQLRAERERAEGQPGH